MSIPSLTESTIRQRTTAESFRRGQDYCQRGAVVSLVERGNVLQAEVEGSQYEPYQVRVTFDAGGLTSAICTCPYEGGGWCKHVVAALLTCLDEPEAVEARPPLEEMLAGLERDQLQALLLDLAERVPELVDGVEDALARLQVTPAAPTEAPAAAPPARRTPVDPQPFRRQVSGILHSLDRMRASEAYWQVGSVVGDVRQLLEQARGFVEGGDGRNALLILEAITDEYVEGWTNVDDSDGYAGDLFEDLGAVWAEALLTADLTPAERRAWAQKLARWQGEIGAYGIDDVFDAAQGAAELGWDYPPLQRVLQGEVTAQGAWEEEAPWYADDLAVARLNVLERQGRYQEYLYLAEAEGQVGRYVTMLAKMGRAQEAVDEGVRYLATADEALKVAQALREREELAAAVRIAEHGLTLEGHKATLATWLCDLAAGMGDAERALRAAGIAFRDSPGLGAYLKVQELAGQRWPELQAELLEHLRKTSPVFAQAHVDVFLHEGLLDDAIAVVEESGGYVSIEQVMDAALERRQRLEWVIQAARKQAERIMDSGKAERYHYAIGWLERARQAYQLADRQAEWQAYLREIRARHGRKYKLMGMIDKFGRG